MKAMDHLLKLKKYRELVSTMMSKELPSTHPEMVVSAFQQLRIRQTLHLALSGHGEEELVSLLEFLRLNLFKSAFFDVLLDVVNVFLTIYGEEEMTPSVLSSVNSLQQSISAEVLLQKQMCKTVGVLDMFILLNQSASDVKEESGDEEDSDDDTVKAIPKTSAHFNEESNSEGEDVDDDLLKVTKRNIFNVVESTIPKDEVFARISSNRVVSTKEVAKKIPKSGIKVNSKIRFEDE